MAQLCEAILLTANASGVLSSWGSHLCLFSIKSGSLISPLSSLSSSRIHFTLYVSINYSRILKRADHTGEQQGILHTVLTDLYLQACQYTYSQQSPATVHLTHTCSNHLHMTHTGKAETIWEDLLQAKRSVVSSNGEFSSACVT